MPGQKRVFALGDPGIHDYFLAATTTWMAGSSLAMTTRD
jgi:hypothetical protein